MESLFCEETLIENVKDIRPVAMTIDVPPMVDVNLVKDQRVLENMLTSEKEYTIIDYCGTGVQREVAPHMRKIVTDWMMEVCEDQQCQPQVFFLAVSYMDRVLSSLSVKKNQFQLLAAVCILLASKFSQVVPITTEQLVVYTDNSVTVDELRTWEMEVLCVLQWEIATTTVHDFLDHLEGSVSHLDKEARRQAEVIAAMAVTEYKFISTKHSVIAAASLAAAVQRSKSKENVIQTLSDLVKSTPTAITFFMQHLPSQKLDTASYESDTESLDTYDSDAESGYSSGSETESSSRTEFVKINEPKNTSSCYSTPKDSYLVSNEVC